MAGLAQFAGDIAAAAAFVAGRRPKTHDPWAAHACEVEIRLPHALGRRGAVWSLNWALSAANLPTLLRVADESVAVQPYPSHAQTLLGVQ